MVVMMDLKMDRTKVGMKVLSMVEIKAVLRGGH